MVITTDHMSWVPSLGELHLKFESARYSVIVKLNFSAFFQIPRVLLTHLEGEHIEAALSTVGRDFTAIRKTDGVSQTIHYVEPKGPRS